MSDAPFHRHRRRLRIGQTWLTDYLARELPAAVIPLDSYYRDLGALELHARAHQNFDVPEALDWDLIVSQVETLAHGLPIERPVYDFSTHTRTTRTERIAPGEFIIIEGLFALYHPRVRELCATRVFMEVEDGVCLARRIERDTNHRGRTRESVIAQYDGTVRPMYDKYILPTRAYAGLVLCGADPVERLAAAVVSRARKAAVTDIS